MDSKALQQHNYTSEKSGKKKNKRWRRERVG
jgi:hypothetical protein